MSNSYSQPTKLTTAKKRRIRKKKARTLINANKNNIFESIDNINNPIDSLGTKTEYLSLSDNSIGKVGIQNTCVNIIEYPAMSSKDRNEVLAAREAKKLAKQKAKIKGGVPKDDSGILIEKPNNIINKVANLVPKEAPSQQNQTMELTKGTDEVDKSAPMQNISIITPVQNITSTKEDVGDKNKDDVKAARLAKKEAKKKGALKKTGDNNDLASAKDIINKSVTETLNKIVYVAKEVQEVSAKLDAIKVDDSVQKVITEKSKADLKAERRAKQEAQRAAKSNIQNAAPVKTEKNSAVAKCNQNAITPKEEKKTLKPKSATSKSVSKSKAQGAHRVTWFQQLYDEREQALRKRILINNSNIHPAIVKLGIQLESRVLEGSNARCIALMNALKQVVKDYTLPAKTDYARGLEAYLVTCLEFLWSLRKPSSSQSNAVKYFRYQLAQLPNNVNEFEAKTVLQEAIDTYIREQIDMAGQAISHSVRKKISSGDHILTYGCSSLIEHILKEAWSAGVSYRAVVVGARTGRGAGGWELQRRLAAHGVPVQYVDVTELSAVMHTVNKVVVGAISLLVNGWVMGPAGTELVALAARAHNVPVLVCCERHKFSERVQTDAFVYNEIGDPDELVDKSVNKPTLKDWSSNKNLTPLNLMYDVTPPSLVTAVITDLAILPCSSAPVVLRFMLSEYGF